MNTSPKSTNSLKWSAFRLQMHVACYAQRAGTAQVSGNFDQPARIMAIRVEGAPNTRESFLASIIKPHFRQPPFPYASSSSTPPSSFGDVLHTTQHISSLLQDTKIFKSVQTSLERSGLPFAGENDVDVVFRCKERGKFFLKTATDIGNQEGSAVSIFCV